MERQIAEELLERYSAGQASPEERALVESWYLQEKGTEILPELQDLLEDQANSRKLLMKYVKKEQKFKLWPAVAVAASLLLCLGIASYLLLRKNNTGKELIYTEVKPGGNKAYLTLASGKRIALSDANNGMLAKEAGIQISKTKEGELIYTAKEPGVSGHLAYNTVETPNGGQYQLHLPDGTKVWLNAASTLKYAVNFTAGSERTVELNGEAYFEVAKDKSRPFLVKSNGLETRVLGTHFNVCSYREDKDAAVSLAEGSVHVSLGAASKILVPGQQAFHGSNSAYLELREVNIMNISAWKDGMFVFEDEDLKHIMDKISRWYNVEVVYGPLKPKVTLTGVIPRNSQISRVLQQLEATGEVQFKIEQHKILVSSRIP